MRIAPRLQKVLDLLRGGPKTAAELMDAGIATPADAVSKLRGYGFQILTLTGTGGRGIYNLLENEK